MLFRWLALAVVGVHAAYLVYIVVGGFLAWRLPRTFLVHVVASGWAFVVVAASWTCPLTTLQNLLRVRGGQPALGETFLDTYVRDVIYPTEYQTAVYVAVAVAVAISWVGFAYLRRRGRRAAEDEALHGNG